MRVLGLDPGTRRVGVALSDSQGRVATPLTTLSRTGDHGALCRAVADLVTEWQVEAVVVGLPLSLDGTVGPAAESALTEAESLRAVLSVPVHTHDERLTTVTAERVLTEQGLLTPARRKVVDQVAASVLLQAWLDRSGRADAKPGPTVVQTGTPRVHPEEHP